jgi:peptidase M23-like protein
MSHEPSSQYLPVFLRHASLCATVAVLLTVWCIGTPLQAQRDERVRPERVQIDWPAAARDAQLLSPNLAAPATSKLFRPQHAAQVAKLLESYTVKEGMLPVAHLSTLMAQLYPGVATIPIPVLAPVDTERYLSAKIRASQYRRLARQSFLSASIERLSLLPGLSGYDALVTISSRVLRDLTIPEALRPQLHIAGTILTYGNGSEGEIVAGMQELYPGLRRLLGDEEATYTFRKYGVPYFINLACSNGPPKPKALTCTQADAIVRIVLRDLRLVGGGPLAIRSRTTPILPRPTKISPDFRYFPPGKLLPGTSETAQGGSPTSGLYGGDLQFPIKSDRAYANSQVFMHWGNCLSTPGTTDKMVFLPKQTGDKFKRYKCKQNPSMVLLKFEGHDENYAYPWRDNYCEARGTEGTVECPQQKGHAGQDIRPSSCALDPKDKSRCSIDRFEVVAVAKGAAMWKTGDYENHVKFVADDGDNKLYYMYLHMSPTALKDAKLKKGEFVKKEQGEKIGKVGNFDKAEAGATTAHLHFEIRRGDHIGKPLSPYLTLIRAYEKLIKAKGTQIQD